MNKKAATPKARATVGSKTASTRRTGASHGQPGEEGRSSARSSRKQGVAPRSAPRDVRPPAASAVPAPSALPRARAGALPPDALGRARRWAQVTARDLMKTDVVTVAYDTPLSEIEKVLADNKISGAPVTDEGGRIVGILSIKDLIDRYTEDPDSRPRRDRGYFHLSFEELDEEDADAFELPAESEDTAQDVMTSQVYTVGPDAGLREIAAEMAKHRIHRVLVEEEGRFLGLLSTTEILEALSA